MLETDEGEGKCGDGDDREVVGDVRHALCGEERSEGSEEVDGDEEEGSGEENSDDEDGEEDADEDEDQDEDQDDDESSDGRGGESGSSRDGGESGSSRIKSNNVCLSSSPEPQCAAVRLKEALTFAHSIPESPSPSEASAHNAARGPEKRMGWDEACKAMTTPDSALDSEGVFAEAKRAMSPAVAQGVLVLLDSMAQSYRDRLRDAGALHADDKDGEGAAAGASGRMPALRETPNSSSALGIYLEPDSGEREFVSKEACRTQDAQAKEASSIEDAEGAEGDAAGGARLSLHPPGTPAAPELPAASEPATVAPTPTRGRGAARKTATAQGKRKDCSAAGIAQQRGAAGARQGGSRGAGAGRVEVGKGKEGRAVPLKEGKLVKSFAAEFRCCLAVGGEVWSAERTGRVSVRSAKTGDVLSYIDDDGATGFLIW